MTPESRLVRWLACAGLGAIALATFARATTRHLLYGDIAEFQFLGTIGGLGHSNGYPVYITVANLFSLLPVGSPSDHAYRINMLSALFGGCSVGLLALFVASIDGRRWVSLFGGFVAGSMFWLLGITWELSTVALPQTFDGMLTLATLLSLGVWFLEERRAFLYWGLFVWGLSFGVHSDTALLGFAVCVLTLAVFPWKRNPRLAIRLAACSSLAFLAGIGVYVASWLLQDARHIPHDYLRMHGWAPPHHWIPSMQTPLRRFLLQVSNVEWKQYLFALPPAAVANNLWNYVGSLVSLFTVPGVALAGLGFVRLAIRRARFAVALGLTFACQLAFWMSYDIPDLPKHLFVSYVLVACMVGFGAAQVVDVIGWVFASTERRGAVRALTAVALIGVAGSPPLAKLVRMVAQDDAAGYAFIRSHVSEDVTEPARISRRAVAALPPNAVVFADWQAHFPLAYVAELERGRRDLLFPRIDHFGAAIYRLYRSQGRPMYAVRKPKDWPPPDISGSTVFEDPLFRLVTE